MKRPLKFYGPLVGLILICTTNACGAMALGRIRGAAILGHPLEVSVPVQLAADEDSSDICFDADVYYGESRQDASRISVKSQVSPQGGAVSVHISSRVAVDEPVVTVYLRSGCGKQATRRYVLLADFASESIALPAPVIAATPSVALVPFVPEAPSVQATVPASVKSAVKSDKPSSEARKKQIQYGGVTAMPTRQKARLKLTPLELGPELDPILTISQEMLTIPGEDAHKRDEAAAMWRALNATPQDVLRDGSRMLAMESDLKALQDQTSKTRMAMVDLGNRLEKAEAQRYANPLVYVLTALLVLCAVAATLLWLRLRSGSVDISNPWFRGDTEDLSKEANVGTDSVMDSVLPVAASQVAQPARKIAEPERGPNSVLYAVDIDLQLSESAFADLGKPVPLAKRTAPDALIPSPVLPASHGMQRDFQPSGNASLRQIKSKEMLDARQQADFFMTLGQHDDAIGVLMQCIDGNDEADPLVYLDLIQIFHTLSQKDRYDQYRDAFHQLFSGLIPAYSDFNKPGAGLDAYPEICDRLVALWPSEDALICLEQYLVSKPAGFERFDLDAFRDLLMLHNLIQRITASSDSDWLPFSAKNKLGNDVDPDSTFGVDLDLSEPAGNLIDFDGSAFLSPKINDPLKS